MPLSLHPNLSRELHQGGKNPSAGLFIRLVKIGWCQTFFCQENLTKSKAWVENMDNYLFSPENMKGLRNLAGAFGVMAATAPAIEAQEADPNVVLAASGISEQVTDCMQFVKDQREAARQNNIEMTRRQGMTPLVKCENGELKQEIEKQRQILADLDTKIQRLDLRVDEQARILDANGQEIARVVAINGQLIIRIEEIRNERIALQADTAAKLAEAERILQQLATS